MSNSPTREEKERAMLKRALDSIDDLLYDEARDSNTTRMWTGQKREMQNIIADAIAQGIR